MIFRIGQAIELSAILEAYGDVARSRQLDDFFDARVLTPACDQDAIEWTACVQSFTNRVYASEFIHRPNSVQHTGARFIVPIQRNRRRYSIKRDAKFQDAFAG